MRIIVTVGLSFIVLASGCSEALLKNARQPPAGVVMGAAIVAAAAGVVAQDGYEPHAEIAPTRLDQRPATGPQGGSTRATMPADVFDRLEHAQAGDAGVARR